MVQVAALKSDTQAHLLRAKALVEKLRLDAKNNNAGPEVGEKWDQVIDQIIETDEDFENIMTLYRLEDGDESKTS